MPTRERDFRGNYEGGYRIIGGTKQTTSRFNSDWYCQDVIGDFGGSHPLDLQKWERQGSRYTELDNAGVPIWDFALNLPAPAKTTGIPNPASFVTRVLSQGGPDNPSVNLPLFIYELKDIPMMLRQAGNLLLRAGRSPGHKLSPSKEAASATLAWQFGWGPLIQDIAKMLNLAEAIDKRQRALEKLGEKKGLRRKITLYENTLHNTGVTTLSSDAGRLIEQRYVGVGNHKYWGSVRWTPRAPWLYRKNPSWMDAFRSALGLNPSQIPITVWKALPWSWAIDWFADVSNVFQATRNTILYKPSQVCIMREMTNTRYYNHTQISPKRWITAGRTQKVWKERFVYNPSIQATIRIPFMDPFKLSILGAFTILGIHSIGRRL